MKQNIIISIVIFCLASVNVFALNNFVKEQKIHHHDFCSVLAHEHSHMHHGVQHSHGHVHKVNLVDFQTADTQFILTYNFDNDRPLVLKQWRIESHPTQVFRPPIS
ncbi:hypothetical protein KKG72_07795 [bacterium]|nr:hypothetical protein [bacterium]MBU1994538.1 hypothetical protein [bacterium]